MLDVLKRMINGLAGGASSANEEKTGPDLHTAVCALFVEMARVDGKFSEAEARKIRAIIQEQYALSSEDARALIAAAEQELDESVDLWHFARVINEQLPTEDKLKIIERLWRIVYIDGHLEAHEDYLMHKLEQLLRIERAQLIEAKLKVLHPE